VSRKCGSPEKKKTRTGKIKKNNRRSEIPARGKTGRRSAGPSYRVSEEGKANVDKKLAKRGIRFRMGGGGVSPQIWDSRKEVETGGGFLFNSVREEKSGGVPLYQKNNDSWGAKRKKDSILGGRGGFSIERKRSLIKNQYGNVEGSSHTTQEKKGYVEAGEKKKKRKKRREDGFTPKQMKKKFRELWGTD